MQKIIHNGRLVSQDQPLFFASNRSFRYGDGLFESMRFGHGRIYWLERHLSRLKMGMEVLQMEIPDWLSEPHFRHLCALLELNGPTRLRLAVFRSGEGTYKPQNNQADYVLEATPLDQTLYPINEKGLHCDLFLEHRLSGSKLENLKTANKLLQVLAARYASAQKLDDVLLLNQKGMLAEATASNLFLLRDKHIFTPPLSSGCLDGIMRSLLIETGRELGFAVKEKDLSPKDIREADALWLTNSIQGIRWIEFFGQTEKVSQKFNHGPIELFTKKLNEKIHQNE
ncbi:MAG: aminotransferase class IV [Bacteroidetes bacterium]|nr:aminotransferase class IV [Bacteroidota bacterium]